MIRPARVFVAVFLGFQLLIVVLGAWQHHQEGRTAPFSWHMFSHVPYD